MGLICFMTNIVIKLSVRIINERLQIYFINLIHNMI